MRALFSLTLLLVSTFTAAAESKGIPSLTNEPVGAGNYLQMFFGLFIVVGLIFGMAWFMRRMGKMHGMSTADLKVMGGVSVGQRERVVLLQAGETQLLIGVAPGEIRTLHVLDKPITLNTPVAARGAAGFAEKLHAAIKNKGQS